MDAVRCFVDSSQENWDEHLSQLAGAMRSCINRSTCLPFRNTWVHLRFSMGFMLLVLYWCVCFVDRCLSFVLFLLVIVLSVLRITDSDYPFGIFKLFLSNGW